MFNINCNKIVRDTFVKTLNLEKANKPDQGMKLGLLTYYLNPSHGCVLWDTCLCARISDFKSSFSMI